MSLPGLGYLVVILLVLSVVTADKCSIVQRTDRPQHAECANIRSMQEVLDEMQANWNRVVVYNRPGAQFSVALTSESSPYIYLFRITF